MATCVFGPSWWPYVAEREVPVLVQISGLDATQTPAFGVDSVEELERWRQTARNSTSEIPWLFSGGRKYHVLSFHERFAHFGPSGEGYRSLVGAFWRGEEPRQVVFGYDRSLSSEDTTGARKPRR